LLVLSLSVGLLAIFCVVSGILVLLSGQISLLRSTVTLVRSRVVISHIVLKVSVLRGVRHAVTTVRHVSRVRASWCGDIVTVQSSYGRRVGLVCVRFDRVLSVLSSSSVVSAAQLKRVQVGVGSVVADNVIV